VTSISFCTNRLLSIIGVDLTRLRRPLITEAELQTYIKMGWTEGAITAEERKLLSMVFTLNDKTVGDIMVPQAKMTVLSIDTPVDELVKIIVRTGYSRFPISRGADGEIIGIIHSKDFFKLIAGKRPMSIKTIMRPPYFVPSIRKIDAQLRAFQAKRLHMAVVLDAQGGTVGLITLEDILEELVGSILDEHDVA
jgi:CBS domain containing-hemolysin-like protein